MTNRSLISKMYKQLIHLNIKKSKNPIKKWTEDLKRLSSKESMQIARRQMKRCSTLQIINKTQVKPQWGTPYTGQNGHNQKNLQTVISGEGVEEREPSSAIGGNISHFGEQFGIP